MPQFPHPGADLAQRWPCRPRSVWLWRPWVDWFRGGWTVTGEGSSGAEIGGAAGQSWVSSSLCHGVSVAARREPV